MSFSFADFLISPSVYKPSALISTFSKAIFSINSILSFSGKVLSDSFDMTSLINSLTNSCGSVLYA